MKRQSIDNKKNPQSQYQIQVWGKQTVVVYWIWVQNSALSQNCFYPWILASGYVLCRTHPSAWEVTALVFKTATGVWDNLNPEVTHIQTLTEIPSVMTASLQRASALLSPSLVNWLKLGITCTDTWLRCWLKISQIWFLSLFLHAWLKLRR